MVYMWAEVAGADLHQRFVDAGGIRTRVIEAGTGDPLILLHGLTGHAETYMRNIRSLSEHFRVIAYDLVGHGFSDRPDRPYTIDLYADQLHKLLDKLGIEKTHLSGVSIGAWISAWYTRSHPERIGRIILNTPGNITNKPEVMTRIKEISLRAVRQASMETARQRLEVLFYERNRNLVTDELVYMRYLIYTQPGYEKTMENILAMQEMDVRKRFAWSEAWCRHIQRPTLVLWTPHDPTGTREEAELLIKWIPRARLHLIEGAGHWPQWETPKLFDDIHVAFLKEAST